jgi:uroporphyrin-III C-methyltransferase
MNVALVGAGPGAPDLITVRGLQRVQCADVLIYDRLVSPALIAQAPPLARRINVGKAPKQRRFPQSEIDRILVEEAQTGLRVVRLKGGDPFVFGLGSSEASALADANIPFEVVPGLTAAVALPGLSGVPLTVRETVTAFAVLSGHYPPGHPQAADFDRLPRRSTLVVLMGRRNLGAIARRLMETGWDADTPTLLIASGTTKAENTIATSLADAEIAAEPMGAPMTAVIGAGVDFRARLSPWLQGVQADDDHPSWGLAREPGS